MRRRFAQTDSDGVVLRVIVADSIEWCEKNLGGTWVETFKDGSQRFNYAGIGSTYDSERDAFIPPKVFESWVLDEATCLWEPPVPMPEDGNLYSWSEENVNWVQVTE